MLKAIKKFLQDGKEKYKVPRSVRDLIPINCIWKDGIFRSGKKYSKTYRFTDINYQTASPDDQKMMFFDYSAVLNGFDTGGTTKMTVNKHRMNRLDIEDSVLMPLQDDHIDTLRGEYNDMILEKSIKSNGSI